MTISFVSRAESCLWNGKTCDDRRVYSQIARWLSVRQTLDVWPLLLVVIQVNGADTWVNGNIIAALEHNDRISELFIDTVPRFQARKVVIPGSAPSARAYKPHTSAMLSFNNLVHPASALASSEDRFLTFSIFFLLNL